MSHAATETPGLSASRPAADLCARSGGRRADRYAHGQHRHAPRGLHRTVGAGAGVLYRGLYVRRDRGAFRGSERPDEQRDVCEAPHADGYDHDEPRRHLQQSDELLAEDGREQRLKRRRAVLFRRGQLQLQPRARLAEIARELQRNARRMRSAPSAPDEFECQLNSQQLHNGKREGRAFFLPGVRIRRKRRIVLQRSRRPRRGQRQHQGRRRAHPFIRLVPLGGAEPL